MKKWRRLLFILFIVACFTNLFMHDAKAEDSMKIHFLDVGQGLAILVQSEGENLVYDGGGRDASSFVVAYLKSQGIETIDYLISSHYDEDHLAGLIGCLHVFEVKNVFGADYEHDSKIYESFMKAVADNGLEVLHPQTSQMFSFGSGEIYIWAPDEVSEQSNNNSLIVKLINGENSFIFMGDAETDEEQNFILESAIDVNSTVLCVGHHGSAYSTSEQFLSIVNPEYAVVSCGAYNEYGHPSAETMGLLEKNSIPVFRTDSQGTITVTSDGNSLIWNAEPCNDYAEGQIIEIARDIPSDSSGGYVLNTNSKKFHYPTCDSVEKMSEKNKAYAESREEIIELGYKPCGNCKP